MGLICKIAYDVHIPSYPAFEEPGCVLWGVGVVVTVGWLVGRGRAKRRGPE